MSHELRNLLTRSNIGHAALSLTLLLYPIACSKALTFLNCQTVEVTTSVLQSLDGSSSWQSRGMQYATPVTVSVLVYNPYYVCWAQGGTHTPVASVAIVVLVLYCIGLPLLLFVRLMHDPWLVAQTTADEAVNTKIGALAGEPSNTSVARNPVILLASQDALLAKSVYNMYRPGAFLIQLADFLLAFILAAVNAFLPSPTTIILVSLKTSVLGVATLGLAFLVWFTHPYVPERAWMRQIRSSLLVITGGSAVMNACATAVASGWGGLTLASLVSNGTYALFVFWVLALLLMLVVYTSSMWTTAEVEEKEIVETQQQHDDATPVINNPMHDPRAQLKQTLEVNVDDDGDVKELPGVWTTPTRRNSFFRFDSNPRHPNSSQTSTGAGTMMSSMHHFPTQQSLPPISVAARTPESAPSIPVSASQPPETASTKPYNSMSVYFGSRRMSASNIGSSRMSNRIKTQVSVALTDYVRSRPSDDAEK